MHEFQSQDLVNRGGVVPVSFEMAAHNFFDPAPLQVRPGKGSLVQKHLLHVPREGIPVPDPKVAELMHAEKKPLEMEWREQMIGPSQPVWHAVIVGIFRLDREFNNCLGGCGMQRTYISSVSAVGRDLARAASPSAINLREMSLLARVDLGARNTVRTKSLSRYGDLNETWVSSKARRPWWCQGACRNTANESGCP